MHLCLMCAPGVRGQAQAGIGVRRAAWGPGPQVRSLLEAHPDLAARGPSPVSPAPPSTGRPPFTRHPSKIPRILWDPLTSWLPESYSRDSCRRPTAGHPQVQMPRYPTPAAPEWRHENADRCVGTLCPSEPSPHRQQVHGGADLQATRRPPFSRPCETGRHAPQSTSQATAFLRNLCGSPWPEPPHTFVGHLPCGEGPRLCPRQTRPPWGRSCPGPGPQGAGCPPLTRWVVVVSPVVPRTTASLSLGLFLWRPRRQQQMVQSRQDVRRTPATMAEATRAQRSPGVAQRRPEMPLWTVTAPHPLGRLHCPPQAPRLTGDRGSEVRCEPRSGCGAHRGAGTVGVWRVPHLLVPLPWSKWPGRSGHS